MNTSEDDIKISNNERHNIPLILNYKKVHDIVHGYISISNYACRIIDSKYFQHLRYKRQLGLVYFVFPNANHTRFEHSIGTYNFASRLLNCITQTTKTSYISEYLSSIPYLKNYFKYKYNGKPKLDKYVCELIKIAALCHDVGHGPFSHLFDDEFLPHIYKNKNITNITHEERSANIIEILIKSDEILNKIILDDEIQFIKHLINPSINDTGFLFQIVSNYLNGLDIDKYDYLIRDSKMLGINMSFNVSRLLDDVCIVDNNICYPEQVVYEIYNMFQLRYNLHKQVYNHKFVISSQIMLLEIMNLVDENLKLSESINDLNKFILFNDNTIFNFLNYYLIVFHNNIPDNIKKALELLDNFNTHKTYKFLDTIISDKFLDIKINNIIETFDKEKQNILKDNIIIFNTKIGFVSGNKNHPMHSIYSYSTKSMLNKDVPDVKKININEVSLLIPKIHQEYLTMVYLKNINFKNTNIKHIINKLKDSILKIKNNYLKI